MVVIDASQKTGGRVRLNFENVRSFSSLVEEFFRYII